MEDIAKYLVRNPKKIVTHFKMLLLERCLISAAFGEDNKDTFLTAILDIDEKQSCITIDCGPKEYLNKRLLDSPIIKCRTEYNGIEVLFEGRRVKKAGKPGQPAFTIPIPNSIYWKQRRQFYRVKSPLSKNSYCTIRFKKSESEEEISANLKLNDISANGVGLLCDNHELSDQMTPPTEFKDCTLVLDSAQTVNISLIVKYKSDYNANKPGKTQRIGCQITEELPSTESVILRYMQDIEREIKQKEK